MTDKYDKSEERRKQNRRSNEIGEDIIDRRRGIDRRVIISEIDFLDRRKSQRRVPIIGVDFKDRRTNDRRKSTNENNNKNNKKDK